MGILIFLVVIVVLVVAVLVANKAKSNQGEYAEAQGQALRFTYFLCIYECKASMF